MQQEYIINMINRLWLVCSLIPTEVTGMHCKENGYILNVLHSHPLGYIHTGNLGHSGL